MRYLRLFELRLRHGFYADERCPDLRVDPTGARYLTPPPSPMDGSEVTPKPREYVESGDRVLARYRLIARSRPDGIEVFAPILPPPEPEPEPPLPPRPFIDFDASMIVRFDLLLDNPGFERFTDLPSKRQNPIYTNRGLTAGGGELQLEAGSTVAGSGVFAGVEITGIDASWLLAPPRFTVTFTPREARWIFPVFSHRAEAPRIVDAESEREGGAIEFSAESLSSAGATASFELEDPSLAAIVAEHSGYERYLLVSKSPIACRQVPTRRLALYMGDELLTKELPNPPVENQSRVVIKEPAPKQSERALYRVITC